MRRDFSTFPPPPPPSIITTHRYHCTHVIFRRERRFRVIGAVTITQGIGDRSCQRQSVHASRASFALAVERRHAFRVAHARSSPYIRLHVRQIAASVAFPIPVRVRVCFFCGRNKEIGSVSQGESEIRETIIYRRLYCSKCLRYMQI